MATLERVTEELQLANEYSDLILDQEVSIDQSQVIMNKKLDDVCYELIKHTSLLSMLTQDIANLKMKEYYRGADNLDNNDTNDNRPAPRDPSDNGDNKKQGWLKKNISKGYEQGKQFESITKRARKKAELGLQNVGEVVGTTRAIASPIFDVAKGAYGLGKDLIQGPSAGIPKSNVDDLEETNDKLDEVVEAVHGVSDAIRQDQKREEFVDRRDARLAKRERTGATRERSTAGPRGIFTGMAGQSMSSSAAKAGLLGGLMELAGDALIAKGLGKVAIPGPFGGGKGKDSDTDGKPKPKGGKDSDTDGKPKPKPGSSQPDSNASKKKPPKIKGLGIFSTLLGLFSLAATADTLQDQLDSGEIDQEQFDLAMKEEGLSIAAMTGGAVAGGALGGVLGSFFPGIGNAVGGILGSIIGAFLGEDAVERFGKKLLGTEETNPPPEPPPPPTPEYDYPVTDYDGNVVANFRSPEEAADYVMKNGGIIGKATLVPTGSPLLSAGNPVAEPSSAMTDLSNVMDYQRVMLEDKKQEAMTGNASVGIVNAPSSNTNVVNNTNIQPGQIVISDPTDKTQANYKR